MAYKVKLNNTEYDLKDGFVIKEELNETLDSGTLQFVTYNGEINSTSFDDVEIYDTNDKIEKRFLLVDSIDDEIYSFGSDFANCDHLYTLTVFSGTKELERIPLPNCSVTQPINGSTRKTVYDEILRFYLLYTPMIKVYDSVSSNHFRYEKKFRLDPEILTRFDSIDCPEFQWNNPTLREVLDDLMSTDDCIVICKEGIISFVDLREKGNEIDTSLLSYSKRSMSSSDYVGELSIDMKNAIGKNKTTCCEYVTLKAPDGSATLTTDNGVITTQHPIYSIKKLVCYAFDTDNHSVPNRVLHHLHAIDVTSRVREFEDWSLLSNIKIGVSTGYNRLPKYTDANGYELPLHRVAFLYYEREGREIKNIGTRYESTVGSYNFSTLVIAGTAVHLNTLDNVLELGSYATKEIDPREIFFYVEYETVTKHSMKVGKYLPSKHPDNRIIDNQNESYVDIAHQSIFEYAKANRLGNTVRKIQGQYFSESDVPKLGDYIGDEILFSREMQYHDDIINFSGMLMPNYVLKDFFTGVRARKRSWQIAKGSDALTRHDVFKVYVEASFSIKKDDFTYYPEFSGIRSITSDVDLIEMLVSIGSPYNSNGNIKWAISSTVDGNGVTYPESGHSTVLDTDIEIQGMSLCFNIGFNDNFKSSDFVTKENDEYTQSFYAYCDSNGEFLNHYVHLVKDIFGIGDGATELPTPLEEGGIIGTDYFNSDQVQNVLDSNYVKPKISTQGALYDNYDILFNLMVRKDNREIINNTIQFEYCSDTKDIVVTRRLIELSRLYNPDSFSPSSQLRIYVSHSERYELSDEFAKGNVQSSSVTVKTTVYDNCIHIMLWNAQSDSQWYDEDAVSWGIGDSNGNLIIGVNSQPSQSTHECYINMLRIRDDKIYATYYSQQTVGDLTEGGIAGVQANYAMVSTDYENRGTVAIRGRVIARDDAD